MANAKRPTIAGTNVGVYAESIYVNKAKKLNKDGSEKAPQITLTARKRRDLDPSAPYAGGYISNKEVKGHDKKYHTQLITKDSLNKILKLNGKPEMSDADLIDAANKTEGGKHHPLITGKDNVAFNTNVFSDRGQKWSHLISQKAINAPEKPFDYSVEQDLNKQAREAKNDKSASKATEKAAPATDASEPEL